MGGGVGISVHGSHRVAGDRFQFAMPEVGIGFFPDVGATWFLPRMPGETGTYCALTGERLRAADAIAAGDRNASRAVGALARADGGAGRHGAGRRAAGGLRRSRSGGPVNLRRKAIDRLFGGDRVEDILDWARPRSRRRREHAGFAGATAALIRSKSPTSLKLALAQVRRRHDLVVRRMHARRISHRLAHRPWARLLRGRARSDHRQGSTTGMGPATLRR